MCAAPHVLQRCFLSLELCAPCTSFLFMRITGFFSQRGLLQTRNSVANSIKTRKSALQVFRRENSRNREFFGTVERKKEKRIFKITEGTHVPDQSTEGPGRILPVPPHVFLIRIALPVRMQRARESTGASAHMGTHSRVDGSCGPRGRTIGRF